MKWLNWYIYRTVRYMVLCVLVGATVAGLIRFAMWVAELLNG